MYILDLIEEKVNLLCMLVRMHAIVGIGYHGWFGFFISKEIQTIVREINVAYAFVWHTRIKKSCYLLVLPR